MQKSTKKWLVASIIVGVFAFVFIQMNYFFNPITFKKDHVTYLPWSWYKKPLIIEYLVEDSHNPGWKVYDVTDPKEIKYIFTELKKMPLIENDSVEQTYGTQRLYIRKYDPNGLEVDEIKGTILLGVHFQSNQTARLKTDNDTFVLVSVELLAYLEERWALAK